MLSSGLCDLAAFGLAAFVTLMKQCMHSRCKKIFLHANFIKKSSQKWQRYSVIVVSALASYVLTLQGCGG